MRLAISVAICEKKRGDEGTGGVVFGRGVELEEVEVTESCNEEKRSPEPASIVNKDDAREDSEHEAAA